MKRITDNDSIKVVECILKDSCDSEVWGADGLLFHYNQIIRLRNHYIMSK